MNILDRITGVESLIEGNNDPLIAGGEAVIEEVRAEVAEAVAEIAEVSAQVEDLAEELDVHEETVEELAEEVAGLESMISGATTFSAGGFASSFNRCARLNSKLGGDNVAVLGAESLTDASSAQMSALAGQESFMTTIKNGAAKAIEYIKAIFNQVINFFVTMVSSTTGIDSRRKQLTDKLGKTDKLKEKINLGGWNVGVDYAKNGADILDKGPFTSLLTDALPAYIDAGKNLDGINAAGFKTAYGKLVGAIKEVAKSVAGSPQEKGDDKRTVIAARGGFAIYLTYSDKTGNDKEIVEAARSVKLSFGKTEGAKEFTKGEVAVKASKGQLQTLLSTVAATVSVLRDSKINQKFSKAERDRVVATLTQKAKDSGEKDSEKKAIELVRAIYSTGASLTTQTNKLLTAQAKQALDLVSAHL